MEHHQMGDRKELITLVYGDPNAPPPQTNTNNQPTPSNGNFTPITPPASTAASSGHSSLEKRKKKQIEEKKASQQNVANRRAEKKEKSPCVSCSSALCFFLLILCLCALALSAIVAHLLALRMSPFQAQHSAFKGHKLTDNKYNMSFVEETESNDDAEEGMEEKKAGDDEVIIDEERHLPPELEPIGYDLSVKAYIPGYESEIPSGKDKIYEGNVTIHLRAKQSTDRIELHSEQLGINLKRLDLYKITVLKKRRVARNAEPVESGSEEEEEGEGQEKEKEGEDAIVEALKKVDTSHNSSLPKSVTAIPHVPSDVLVQDVEGVMHEAPVGEVTVKEQEDSYEEEIVEEQKEEESVKGEYEVKEIIVKAGVSKIIFILNKNISTGSEFTLFIPYMGQIRYSVNGMYLTEYVNQQNKTRYMAMTHMEPQYARRFVPCFDEPKYKAPWTVQVIHPKGSTASSNAMETETKHQPDGWLRTHFQPTPPMSTYLLSIVVSDFVHQDKTTKGGKLVRLWTRPESINQTVLALDASVVMLDYFDDYYGVPYPLPKLDIVAAPRFEAGAMENWGLLLFREERLIYDPAINALSDKRRVLETIAHEISHQWFGDLVTLAWWNDLWLNEGLAVYFAGDMPDVISNGEMNSKDSNDITMIERALDTDSNSQTHPISYKIEQPRDIAAAFDAITYQKGSAIIRMLKTIISEEHFKAGIVHYIERNKYKSSTSADLFASFDEVLPETVRAWDGEKLNVHTFASNWILQMGYPVVNVERVNNTTVQFAQYRYKQNNITEERAAFRNAKFWFKWDIPLWYSIDGQDRGMNWLHHELRLPLNRSQLLLINANNIGFYRVNYHQEGWENIIKQLNEDHTVIPPLGRTRLISDAFALASAGHLTYKTAFDLTEYMSEEKELGPWMVAVSAYSYILGNYRDCPEGEAAREFIKKRIESMYKLANWDAMDKTEDKEFVNSQLSSLAISNACKLGISDCQSRSFRIFNEQFVAKCADDGKSLPSECSTVAPSSRVLVYCNGVARSHPAFIEKWKRWLARERNHKEKSRLVHALGCSRDVAVLKDIISETILDNSSPSANFISTLLASVMENPVADYVMQDYITEEWRGVHKSLKEHQFALDRVIKVLPIVSKRRLEQLNSFLSSHKMASSRLNGFNAVIATAKTRQDWKDRHEGELDKIFKTEVEIAKEAEEHNEL